MLNTVIVSLLKIAVLLNAVLVAVTFLVLMERKVIAWAQSRLGPMRVGPHGILQAIADPIKLILKEDITPAKADKWVFTIAPIMSLVPALVVFAVIPFGPDPLYYVSDINVGVLFIVSVTSIGVYGIILGGWASNSKYPLLASLRASAQLISYEIAVTMTLVSVILTAGTLSLVGVVEAQRDARVWFGFIQPVALPWCSSVVSPRPTVCRSTPGGRDGVDRRLPHRVQRHAVFAVFPGGVREHHRHFGGCGDHVSGRVDAPVPQRNDAVVPRCDSAVDLVRREDLLLSLHLHLDTRDASTIPLRPADEFGMEGSDPRLHSQTSSSRGL